MESTIAVNRSSARAGTIATGLFCLILLLIYRDTVWSMVTIWSRSDTFAHGFLILPISLWLVWTQRHQLGVNKPVPAPIVAFLTIPLGLVWLLAWLVDVIVIQQLALVAMIIVGTWAILGHHLARIMAFPLLFLFFAVPMGGELIAPMMEYTASSTVWMVQMTGIPVYREGLNFSLPSGNWSVVEACSGVRYIIASVTVGTLYAYLTFRSLPRRLIFVVIAAIVPIFANSIRAYIIVMLGHLSNMKIATGVDHLVYGWLFFGLVIFTLFWLGSFFREDQLDETTMQQRIAAREVNTSGTGSNRLLWLTALSALLLASIAPVILRTVFAPAVAEPREPVSLPGAHAPWSSSTGSEWSWRPPTIVAVQQSAFYTDDGQETGLFVQYANAIGTGGDVVGSSTIYLHKDPSEWVVLQDKVVARVQHNDVVVDQALLRGPEGELLVWSWYLVGDVSTSNNYQAKFDELGARLKGDESATYRIVVATPMRSSLTDTQLRLQNFIDDYAPPLYEEVQHTVLRGSK